MLGAAYISRRAAPLPRKSLAGRPAARAHTQPSVSKRRFLAIVAAVLMSSIAVWKADCVIVKKQTNKRCLELRRVGGPTPKPPPAIQPLPPTVLLVISIIKQHFLGNGGRGVNVNVSPSLGRALNILIRQMSGERGD